LRGEFKTAGRELKFTATRRIAAQRENVFTTERVDFFQKFAHLSAGVPNTGEMCQRRETVLPLDAIHNHQCFVARAAAGAVGDGTIIGPGQEQGGYLLFQRWRSPSPVFGGKNSKEMAGRPAARFAA